MPEDYTALAEKARQQAPAAGTKDYTALAAKARGEQPAAEEEGIGTTLSHWWDQVNPLAAGNAINQAVMHPIDTLKGIGAGSDELRLKAVDAWKRGDPIEAANHALNYVINSALPGTGQSLDVAGEHAQKHEWSAALGDTAGIATNLFAPELARKIPVQRVKAFLTETANPKVRAANREAMQRGVKVPLGSVTENRSIQGLQQGVENSPVGSGVVRNVNEQNAAAFEQWARDVGQEVHPAPVTPLEAGKATGTAINRQQQNLRQQAHPVPTTPLEAGERTAAALGQGVRQLRQDITGGRPPVTPLQAGTRMGERVNEDLAAAGAATEGAYETGWQGKGKPQYTESVPVRMQKVPEIDERGFATGQMVEQPVFADVNMPVDVRDLKAQIRPTVDEMSWMPAPERNQSAGYQAMIKILEGPDFISASEAELGLGGLKTMARVESKNPNLAGNPNLRNTGQGLAASVIPTLQQRINQAVAKTGQESLEGLQAGRALNATKMEIKALAEELRAEPVQAFEQATWAGDAGVGFLKRIQGQTPDVLPVIGRAWREQAFEKAAQGGSFKAEWGKLGTETRKFLFSPGEVKLMDALAGKEPVVNLVRKLETSPVQMVEHLVADRDTHLNDLRQVAAERPDMMPVIGRAWKERAFEKATAGGSFRSQWNALGPETRKLLFTPQEQATLQSVARKETLGKLGRQIADTPVQGFKHLLGANDVHINDLRRVKAAHPAMVPMLGRAWIEDVVDTATAAGGFERNRKLWNMWDNLGDETKRILYTPEQRSSLDNLFLAQRKLAERPNPSGSGVVGGLLAATGYVFQHPVKGIPMVIAGGPLADMMYNPEAVRALTRGMTVDPGNRLASIAAANRILKLAGNAAQPQRGADMRISVTGGGGAPPPNKLTRPPLSQFERQ